MSDIPISNQEPDDQNDDEQNDDEQNTSHPDEAAKKKVPDSVPEEQIPEDISEKDIKKYPKLKESIIKRSRGFVEQGRDLKEVKTKGLHRLDRLTWKEFCSEILGLDVSVCDKTIAASKVYDILFEHNNDWLLPANESQARPLAVFLTNDEGLKVIQAWKKALDLSNEKQPTQEQVTDARAAIDPTYAKTQKGAAPTIAPEILVMLDPILQKLSKALSISDVKQATDCLTELQEELKRLKKKDKKK